MKNHFYAITSNSELAINFGISKDNIFPLWSEIGGWFSISSFIGGVITTIMYSYKTYKEFLDGGKLMDEIFFNQKNIKNNFAVLLALIDHHRDKNWNF